MNWWAARTAITIFSAVSPSTDSTLAAMDAEEGRDPAIKEKKVATMDVSMPQQLGVRLNPDARITLGTLASGTLLQRYATPWEGMTTGGIPYAVRFFWEVFDRRKWRFLNGSVDLTIFYGGREQIVLWGEDGEAILTNSSAVVKGREAFGKRGIRVSQMRKECPNICVRGVCCFTHH